MFRIWSRVCAPSIISWTILIYSLFPFALSELCNVVTSQLAIYNLHSFWLAVEHWVTNTFIYSIIGRKNLHIRNVSVFSAVLQV